MGKQKVIEKLIEGEFSTDNFDISIEYTRSAKHAIQISNNHVNNFNIIVAVGGDGSVNEIARGLINTNTKLAIIPTGSGNGLARHLNIPLDLKKALSLIKEGKITTIDSIKVNDEYFFCTAGIGIDAFISWKFAKAKKRGFWSYLKITINSFHKYKPKDYKFLINNVERDFKKVMLATVANANQFGNNVIISPNSIIDDGLVRLIIIKKFSFIYVPSFIYYLLAKKIHKFKYCEEFKTDQLTIFNDLYKIHLDGEPIETDKKIEIKTIPQSLKIIVP